MRRVAIVIIGNEILLGRVTDTNSGAISRAVDAHGAETVRIVTVGDDGSSIKAAVKEALDCADIVFTTGGLGPTKDDMTKTVLTRIFGGKLVRDDAVTANIEALFSRRGLTMNRLTLDQALVPSSARVIQNRYGTAPIMVFEKVGKCLVAMPGVPSETEGMLPEVIGRLQEKGLFGEKMSHATRVVTGMSESALATALDAFESGLPDGVRLAYLPDSPVIKLRLDGSTDAQTFERSLRELDSVLSTLPDIKVLSLGDKGVFEILAERLREKGFTLSTAESCTGGNIAHRLTAIPGVSDVYIGSVVSYANRVKTDILGVNSLDIEREGVVSRSVVEQMAEGVSKRLGTDCAVATSGIAGPGGATPGKPVGTVWIAAKTPDATVSQCFHFNGKRDTVIERASKAAALMLLGLLG